MNKKILILGTGVFARVFLELIEDISGCSVCGFVENLDRSKCEEKINGFPVYWIDDIPQDVRDAYAICSLGTTKRSVFVEQAEQAGLAFTTLIHPRAHVAKSVQIGTGCMIGPGAVVSSNTTIGDHVRINRGVLIGHDTVIERFTTVQPGANIAGKCRIGEKCYIGMSATVIDGMQIGSYSVVGAGAVVVKDVPQRVKVVGVPAKIIEEGIDGL